MQPWEFVQSESSHDYGIFKTRVDHLRSPRTQHVLRRVIVEPPDWVNVVARTQEGSFLMVRQIRHGIAAPSLEIPAGAIEPQERPDQAAARELIEETGYQAASLRELGRVFPNPAFQTNTCYLYLADGCRRVQEPQQDPGEDIHLELWSWKELLAAIRDGRIRHSLVIAALYYLRDHEDWAQA
jgi:8-oxo-dGTP pyrophosphatase MutT (NUDIX family)